MAGALLLAAINVSAQQKSGSTAKKPAATPLTKASASKIIEMTNGVVDIYNDQIREIRDVEDCLDRFEKTIEAVSENPNTSAHGASCNNIRVLRNDLVDKMKSKAKLAPAFAEKTEILDGVDNLNKEFELAKVRCQNVQNYFSTKKYKEDDENYSTYSALIDTFVVSYKNINTILGNTMDLASNAGDRAELVVLKTHPLANIIIPMKTNLSAVSQLMSKCRQDEPNAEEIKAAVADIRKKIEKDKVMTPAIKTALKKTHNGESQFNYFYQYTGEAMEKADKFLEYLDPNTKITDIDHVFNETEQDARNRHLKNRYNDLKSYYGYMVDAYNNL